MTRILAVPAKSICCPVAIWREIELDIFVRTFGADEGLKTGMLPQLIPTLCAPRSRYFQLRQVASEVVTQLHTGAQARDLDGEAVHTRGGMRWMADELDLMIRHALSLRSSAA